MLDLLLGSKTRARILEALLLDGGRYRLLELQRAVGTSVSSVQKELDRLESIGIVRSQRVAGARFLSAEKGHPLAEPLVALLVADREVRGAVLVDLPLARVNPAIRPRVAEIAAACRRHGAVKAALVGSATQPDASVTPVDLDVLVHFGPAAVGYAERYFGLLAELERIMGMPVEVIEEDALTNPYLRDEFAATQVVLYEAA